MAVDTYMKIDGVPGESTDDQHKDWIELTGFDHSFKQPPSASSNSAGGLTSGRVNMDSFVVTKRMDKASPKLYEYCCSGKSLPSVTIEMMRASGDSRVKYMEVKMENVLVASVNKTGGSTNEDGFPTEKIGLQFATIKWTYTQQKMDGSSGGNTTGGWNLSANKATA